MQTQLIEAPSAPIFVDTKKLGSGAKKIVHGFDEKHTSRIQKAMRVTQFEVQGWCSKYEDTPPEDVEIAELLSRLEASQWGQIGIRTVINTLQENWPVLTRKWLEDMHRAVVHIRSEGKLNVLRGPDRNFVNETDHTTQVNWAAGKLKVANEIKPTLFYMDGRIVEVIIGMSGARISLVKFDRFDALLNMVCQFRKAAGDGYIGVPVPREVSKFLYNYHALPLPELNGISSIPFFDETGRYVRFDGFDLETGMYLDMRGLDLPRLPKSLSQDDVKQAIALISDIFADFELDGVSRLAFERSIHFSGGVPTSSFLNVVGACLEQFVRPMIKGPVMPMLISKTAPGAGGGLLVQVIQHIVMGSGVPRPLANSEEERRKAITSLLSSGTRMVSWDNVVGSIDSPCLASLFTEERWTDRQLGSNTEMSFPVSASFILVGNRPLLSSELQRRMSLVELKPNSPNPAERSGFKYTHLMRHVRANRSALIGAFLVLAKHWIDQGQPKPSFAPQIGSYEEYRDVIGGIIECVSPTWTTWQGNRAELSNIADNGDEDGMRQLVQVAYRDQLFRGTSSEWATLARDHEIDLPVKTIHGEPCVYNPTSLGMYLKGFVGTVFEADGTNVRFTKSPTRGRSGHPWVLEKSAAR